uniref:Uncharacterized protein n=1 Tax=Romanomermis culicivorax TaxID=13658 RepID=A0A915KTE4_ROMCU
MQFRYFLVIGANPDPEENCTRPTTTANLRILEPIETHLGPNEKPLRIKGILFKLSESLYLK